MKVLNTKYKAARGVSSDNYIRTSLVNNQRFLPTEDFNATVDEIEVYNEERENCNKIRLIVTINPLCSNVLFNRITEVVYKEGSDDCKCLNFGNIQNDIDRNDLFNKYKSETAFTKISQSYGSVTLTRDTQLSRHDYYDYKCGIDIFNNHILRSLTFKSVCKETKQNPDFNTLFDTMREWDGSTVKGYSTNSNEKIDLHLYLAEEVLPYDESVDVNLSEDNGWLGFYNNGKLLTYGEASIPMEINRVINNKPSCGFIDMCPSRDLFYFTPKYNKSRNRFEQNWNYCLTYPSRKITDGISFIDSATKGLKVYYFDDEITSGGINLCKVVSFSKHGLEIDDTVRLYFNMRDGSQIVKDGLSVAVIYDEYSFAVKFSQQDWICERNFIVWQTANEFNEMARLYNVSIKEIMGESDSVENEKDNVTFTWNPRDKRIVTDSNNNQYVVFNSNGKYKCNLNPSIANVTFKQMVKGLESEYYVRIFSRIPNWKFAEVKLSDYMDETKRKQLIKEYSGKRYDFDSTLGKAAFAKNAYGDDMSQIVFTDDIDISGLTDHLGRPLTEIYLTIIKNNAGYREWYGKNSSKFDVKSDVVEYSHVFGKNSCAFELCPLSAGDSNHQNILQNNNLSKAYSSQGLNITTLTNRKCSVLDNDEIEVNTIKSNNNDATGMLYDGDTEFYGDLCMYVPSLLGEITIDDVWFRFNTAQRELTPQDATYVELNNLTYDEIVSDDYDANRFRTRMEVIPNATMASEGYKYKPHYKIPIKSFSTELMTAKPRIVSMKSIDVNEDNSKYTIITNDESYIEKGDEFILFNQLRNKYYKCDADEVESPTKFTFTYNSKKNDNEQNPLFFDNVLVYSVIKKQETIPSDAVLLTDGSLLYAWREVYQNGFDSNSPNETYPFTNNALYIEKSINFFCKRQDPDGYMKSTTASSSFIRDVEPNKPSILDEDDYISSDNIQCYI